MHIILSHPRQQINKISQGQKHKHVRIKQECDRYPNIKTCHSTKHVHIHHQSTRKMHVHVNACLWTQGGVKIESPPSFCNSLGTIYIASFQGRTF